MANGKLNVFSLKGNEDRLVLDTTANGPTDLCGQEEDVSNPTPKDIIQLACNDASTDDEAFPADVKAAHKSTRLHPSEQGLLFFEMLGMFCNYIVCPSGDNGAHVVGPEWVLSFREQFKDFPEKGLRPGFTCMISYSDSDDKRCAKTWS